MQALMEIGTHKTVQGKMSHGARRRRRKAAARAGAARRAELERDLANQAQAEAFRSKRAARAEAAYTAHAKAINHLLKQISESTHQLREEFRLRRLAIRGVEIHGVCRRALKRSIWIPSLERQLATHCALKRQLVDLELAGTSAGYDVMGAGGMVAG